jgi:hypothetical protein
MESSALQSEAPKSQGRGLACLGLRVPVQRFNALNMAPLEERALSSCSPLLGVHLWGRVAIQHNEAR